MTAEFVIQIFGIVIAPIITMGILASSKLIDTPRGKKIALAAILCAVLCLVLAIIKEYLIK